MNGSKGNLQSQPSLVKHDCAAEAWAVLKERLQGRAAVTYTRSPLPTAVGLTPLPSTPAACAAGSAAAPSACISWQHVRAAPAARPNSPKLQNANKFVCCPPGTARWAAEAAPVSRRPPRLHAANPECSNQKPAVRMLYSYSRWHPKSTHGPRAP